MNNDFNYKNECNTNEMLLSMNCIIEIKIKHSYRDNMLPLSYFSIDIFARIPFHLFSRYN